MLPADKTGLSRACVPVSVVKTARSWEAWTWQESWWSWESCPALAALGDPGACMHVVSCFPAERHAQGPGANWEQVAGLADVAEMVADCGVGWAGLVP